jgi:hypothetical protein
VWRCCARPERRTAHRTSRKSTASSTPSIPPGAPAAGDLCLILIDQVEDALAHIAKRIKEA